MDNALNSPFQQMQMCFIELSPAMTPNLKKKKKLMP